ncbi:MAG: HTH domain-containing protein [Bacteroidales bacterium]|nr:HTH domain-containing protein [Bacteroidales bacterium]
MAYEDYCLRMESLQHYIRQENTGCAKELAEQLGISQRTLFHDLEVLRAKGIEIQYDKHKRTYHFVKKNR